MTRLTLSQAEAILEGAFAYSRAQGLKPLAVSVQDRDGSLLAFKREDGTPAAYSTIAQGKANGGLALGRSSRKVEDIARERPTLIAALAVQTPVFTAPGGVLIQGEGEPFIGAVGVSGDTGDNDELVAIAGIKAAGLTPVEP